MTPDEIDAEVNRRFTLFREYINGVRKEKGLPALSKAECEHLLYHYNVACGLQPDTPKKPNWRHKPERLPERLERLGISGREMLVAAMYIYKEQADTVRRLLAERDLRNNDTEMTKQ